MAISMNEIRQQFPQYEDLSDVELLRGVHSKYYSDIPFEQFTSKIEITTPAVEVTEKRPSPEEVAAFEAEQAGLGEQMFGFGSPTYSFLRGLVVEPALAVNQALANTGIFGETVKQGATDIARREALAVEQAKEKQGREGFDFAQLAGGVLSPVNKLLPVASAATKLGRLGQTMVTGGLGASLQPALGEDFLSEKTAQIGLGAVFSGVFTPVASVFPVLSDLVKKLPITAKNKEEIFKKYVAELSPDKRDEVISELRKAGEIVEGSQPTVGEALADLPSAYKIAKAQETLTKDAETAGKFIERRAAQQSARVKSLEDVFGSQADLDLAIQSRLTSTTPMRDRALREADFYGETASKLEEQLAKGTTQFGTLAPKQKQDLIKAQVENIKANGYYPLTSKSLIDKIDTMANTPGLRSNDMLNYAMTKLRGKLAKLTDERGVINSADLYNVRKEIAQDLSEYLGDKNVASASFRAQATAAETQLKKLIDTEINKASGSNLWSEYLTNFAKHSRKIDQLELGQTLKSKLSGNYSEETAGKFLQAITEAPATIKRATGQSRYQELGEVLDDKQLADVNRVYADLVRQEKALANTQGITRAPQADISSGQEIPGFVSAKVTALKSFFGTLARGSQKEFDNKMTELLLDPQKFADLLETLPQKNQDEIVKAISTKMSPSLKQRFKEMYATTTSEQVGRAYIQTESESKPPR